MATNIESSYDYTNINAFSNSDAVKSLNGSTIQRLREAEEKARLKPIENDLNTWDEELKKITEIEDKINDFLTSSKSLDLYTNDNAFEQFSASTSGTSAIFDAVDTSKLDDEVINVSISQLANRDVYQSNSFSDKTALIDGGQDDGDKITLSIGGTDYDFSTVDKSYQDLADDINKNDNFMATVEQVGDDSYRLIIKSKDTGENNAITISQTGVDLGLEDDANHVLTAQNLQATVNGVDYDISSNTIALQNGINITAVSTGDSAMSIKKDTASIIPAIEDFVSKYNDLVDIIDGELYDAKSPIQNKSTLSMYLNSIKDKLYSMYGSDGDKNVFNYGISLDKTGHLSIDNEKLGDAITNNFDDLKELFIGTAENEGLGTTIADYIKKQNLATGLIGSYGDNMADRKTRLEEDKEKVIKDLDTKYDLMARQFIEYGAIIAQMESSFSSLKMMMEQSNKN